MQHHPKFRTDLKCSTYRESDGTETIILKEPVSEKFFRLSCFEFELLRALDGKVSLAEALQKLRSRGLYYSEEDARLILGKAAQSGLVLGTSVGTAKNMQALKEQMQKGMNIRRLSGYYFFNVPLWNPDNFLTKTVWLFNLLCNKWTAVLLAAAFPGAVYLLFTGLPRIEREYLFFFNWQNVLCLWVVIVFTKLVHEFSHAYTAKSFGLHVPQMGIAFLLFLPCLFCNTTDAWQLANRRQRIAISAAGILAEAAMALVATYVWYFSRPGIINSLAFYMMTISVVSTVIFNANPLIKFDGYFMLMDYLRIPNLFTKSMEHIKHLFMGGVLGLSQTKSPARSPRETTIFTVYGIGSFLYRISLYIGIVAGIYYRFDKFLGIALAIPAFALFVVRPVAKGIKVLITRRAELHPRPKGVLVFSVLLVGAYSLFFISWPRQSAYPCYVTSGMTQKITVPLALPIERVFVRLGSVVAKGDLLFTLDTTRLELALAQRKLDRDIIRKEIELLMLSDEKRAQADSKRIELLKVEDQIRRLQEKLTLAGEGNRARFDGIVTELDHRMQSGFKPGEGAIVGQMEDLRERVVHALIPEEDLSKVRKGQVVKIWLPLGTGSTFKEAVESLNPYSETNLSDSPFSSRLGGKVATEVKNEHEKDAPLRAYYTCSARIPHGEGLPLGLTGRMIVASTPRSVFGAMVDHLTQTFNRESLL